MMKYTEPEIEIVYTNYEDVIACSPMIDEDSVCLDDVSETSTKNS